MVQQQWQQLSRLILSDASLLHRSLIWYFTEAFPASVARVSSALHAEAPIMFPAGRASIYYYREEAYTQKVHNATSPNAAQSPLRPASVNVLQTAQAYLPSIRVFH